MAEDRSLPGMPKKRLVQDVKKALAGFGIRPSDKTFTVWRATWLWANAVAVSYSTKTWPIPSEIATQYVVLLLAQMRQSHFRLPYRAGRTATPQILQLLGTTPLLEEKS